MCQEFILQWSKRIDELDDLGVTVVMISIGKPEVGKELIDHLVLDGAERYLFVGELKFSIFYDLRLLL